jgi:hypothetical protein
MDDAGWSTLLDSTRSTHRNRQAVLPSYHCAVRATTSGCMLDLSALSKDRIDNGGNANEQEVLMLRRSGRLLFLPLNKRSGFPAK